MAAPSQVDIIAGLDPTALSSVTPAQLLTMVASATPYTDKGFTIVTLDVAGNPTVPNATVTTKWQNYLWIRQSATSVGLYVWNPAGAVDATYLQWQSVNLAGIGAGTIQGYMIADNTITDAKIISLNYSKLSGAPTGLPPSGAAGGDLTGTYPNPSVGPLAVTTSKVALLNITNALLEAGGATTGIDTTAKLKVPQVALVVPRVKSDLSAIEWVAASATGARLMQMLGFSTVTSTSNGATAMVANTVAAFDVAHTTATALLLAVTPIAGTLGSKIKVVCTIPVFTAANTDSTWVALYNGTSFVAWAVWTPSATNAYTTVTLQYLSAALVANTTLTYTVYLGSTVGTANHGAINKLGEGATIVIEEYL